MKAVVVGGTGFVGMNVVSTLVSAGHDVVATRRAHGNTLFARKLGARLVEADLDEPTSLGRAMRGADVVFMCAGHYPRFSLDREHEIAVARRRVRASLEAALDAGVRRYVLTSSVATIGAPPDGRSLADERDVLEHPPAVYHAVKLAIEDEARRAHRRGLDVVVLCPSGVLGALDVKAGTGFLVVALGNDRLPFYVDGKLNVVDAATVGHAHLAAALHGAPGARYIVGGHNVTLRTLLEVVADELGIPLRAARLPAAWAALLATFDEMRCAATKSSRRPFLSRELIDVVRHGQWVSHAKATQELGLPPPPTLVETVRAACRWYRRHRYLPMGGPHAQHPA